MELPRRNTDDGHANSTPTQTGANPQHAEFELRPTKFSVIKNASRWVKPADYFHPQPFLELAFQIGIPQEQFHC